MPERLAERYRVLDRLGAGGMATVFLAEDERLGRRVAVKRLHSHSPDDAALRFEREAKVGASLSHPNLATVFDTVADDEGVLIVMEFVEGDNLASIMSRERLPTERAVDIVKAVGSALDHAHAAGVIHRDVKPANVIVAPGGTVKLVDLGIATAAERTQITSAGTVLGTPSYMPAEQLEGRPLTKAVDVYALAAMAYEMLSGRKPRQGRTPMEIAHQIANGPPADLREAWPGAPAAAADVLRRALSTDPSQRQGSAGELARELEEAVRPDFEPTPVPFQRDERDQRAARVGAVHPATSRTRTTRPLAGPTTHRRGLPTWIPLVGLLLVLAVVAGAVAALVTGGDDKGTAPVVATEKKAPKKAAKPKSTSQQQSTQQQSTSQQPAAASGGPEQGAALHAQAHDLINQGQYDKAIQLEQQAIPMLENSGRIEYWYALYDLGHALRLAGRPDEAIPILQKRLQNPNQQGVVKQELEKAQAEASSG